MPPHTSALSSEGSKGKLPQGGKMPPHTPQDKLSLAVHVHPGQALHQTTRHIVDIAKQDNEKLDPAAREPAQPTTSGPLN